jgi:predicted RNA-binding Zn ribbon-like protein
MSRTRITFSGEQFDWDRTYPDGALDRFLWNIVQDAADFMTSDELDRIGQCAGDNCEWLFLDMSKNRSRQWCTMEDCGNRAKARRFYNRKKRSSSSHENTPSGSA